MKIADLHQLAGMIDISAVRTDVTLNELSDMAHLARYYQFACAYTMPCFTTELMKMLEGDTAVQVGGVVSFPSGADTTRMKVQQAKELINLGCAELDMVINVGALKSGLYQVVQDDIRAVVNTAGAMPVKAILEIAYLNREEIMRGSEIIVAAGAKYVKTGTGWASKPTSVEDVELIKRVIGNSARIKVAGGVRSLDMMLHMIEAGCSRFGIGYKSSLQIMREIDERLGVQPYHGARSK